MAKGNTAPSASASAAGAAATKPKPHKKNESKPKKLNKTDQKWMDNYERLKQYKAEHGHTAVSPEYADIYYPFITEGTNAVRSPATAISTRLPSGSSVSEAPKRTASSEQTGRSFSTILTFISTPKTTDGISRTMKSRRSRRKSATLTCHRLGLSSLTQTKCMSHSCLGRTSSESSMR